MFLAIDIGNTTTMIGFFEGDKLRGSFRIASSHAVTADECGILIHQLLQFHAGKDKTVRKVGICSVVPTLTQIYISMAEKYFKLTPVVLNHATPNIGFKILYDESRQVGPDRIANAAAARALYGYPAIIVDLGTATTYDILDSDGNYVGGMIAPGVWTSAANLFKKASRLFSVKLEKPENFIAKNTADSLKSGIYYGFIGQMEYLVDKIKRELNIADCRVVATGGYSEIFMGESKHLETVDTELTLKGLRIIFDG
ncbi:MAG: type III pantothenate kinase [candidate division Zixibacteria bacterium]